MFTNPEDRTRRPWLALIVSLLLVSIGGTVWQSFTTLQLHAVHVGWHTPAVLPIIIDAFYVATLAAYIRRPDRYTLLASFCAALVLSAGNALAYLYDPASAYLVAPMPIVIVTGIVPPVFALGVAHFLVHERKASSVIRAAMVESVGSRAGDRVRAPVGDADVGPRVPALVAGGDRPPASPRVAKAARPPVSAARKPSAGDLERAQRVIDNGWQDVKLDDLPALLGCSYVPGQRARKLARERLAAVPNGNVTLVE